MPFPIQVACHGISHSHDIDEKANMLAEKLNRFGDEIISCRVTVEVPHRNFTRGNPYEVTVCLFAKEKVIKASTESLQPHGAAQIGVAMKNAFHLVSRQLEEHLQLRRDFVREPMLVSEETMYQEEMPEGGTQQAS